MTDFYESIGRTLNDLVAEHGDCVWDNETFRAIVLGLTTLPDAEPLANALDARAYELFKRGTH
ncbi:hypothetical protein EDB69_3208 [Vibrio crassostreae]|uniref:hypothetical protein n=1 Tax=Vibrio crassostreae TaxID=246167 RepID=UPI000F4A4229|nr:hypothetical protein [Vibrio crassostreae]ROO70423.1 hypothetical protein EDB64_2928 [Vibrio crassostreae]ROP08648.1 hypothetical protein EDB63_2652 [Vibrio crassostreae]RPE91446.1 hypothetical protein EDB68_2655 [Vibrio crassostreae]RPF14719.1 hypothetical protein EDB69_3208 [Vibrio crassostreae]